MGQILREATVEEWTEFLFARPVDEPAWYWETDADRWEGSPERTVELLAETFERSGELLEPFDDEQVGQGLWMIASSSGPDIVRPLLDEAVPWDLRKRALESIFILFHDCFAVRCSNHLGHLEEPDSNPLNTSCYMWWDLFPLVPEPENPALAERDGLILSIMARTLELPSAACQEAALHGLGEWERAYPEQVHEVVERFIWANRKIRPPLRHYAYAALHGDVP